MALTDPNQLIPALPAASSYELQAFKNSLGNAVSGQDFSIWRPTGVPGQGGIPTAAADCDHTTVGGWFPGLAQQTAPTYNYMATLEVGNGANNGQLLEIYDRLRHMGGLNGTLTTAQTVNLSVTGTSANMVERRGASDYREVQWWLEWYADTGATSVNVTVAVTYDDASTGNIVLTGIGTTVRIGRMIAIQSAVPGRWIRSVDSVTLSATTGAAGNFGVTATKFLFAGSNDVTSRMNKYDWADLPVTVIPSSACGFGIATVAGTATGTVRARGRVVVL